MGEGHPMHDATKADILLDLWSLARTLRVGHRQPEDAAAPRQPEPVPDAPEKAGKAIALALAAPAAALR